MKVCFMGTPDFAVPALERLADSRHSIELVVTQPSKPQGRGNRVADPPVKVAADARGLRVVQPASLRRESLVPLVRELGVDVAVVVAYGKMLPDDLLAAPRLGCLNIHPSMLPEYRGAAPIQRALMDGRLETGVTIIKLVSKMDAGPIVAQEPHPIEEDDDHLSLSNYLSVVGADLTMRVLDEAEREGVLEGVEQDESRATYAPPIRPEEGLIPWTDSSVAIVARLRGVTPWPGLYTTIQGRRLEVLAAEPMTDDQRRHIAAAGAVPPGTISGLEKGYGFSVRTGDGHLMIREVQLEGKRRMDATSFWNGARLKAGVRLGDAAARPAEVEADSDGEDEDSE